MGKAAGLGILDTRPLSDALGRAASDFGGIIQMKEEYVPDKNLNITFIKKSQSANNTPKKSDQPIKKLFTFFQ